MTVTKFQTAIAAAFVAFMAQGCSDGDDKPKQEKLKLATKADKKTEELAKYFGDGDGKFTKDDEFAPTTSAAYGELAKFVTDMKLTEEKLDISDKMVEKVLTASKEVVPACKKANEPKTIEEDKTACAAKIKAVTDLKDVLKYDRIVIKEQDTEKAEDKEKLKKKFTEDKGDYKNDKDGLCKEYANFCEYFGIVEAKKEEKKDK